MKRALYLSVAVIALLMFTSCTDDDDDRDPRPGDAGSDVHTDTGHDIDDTGDAGDADSCLDNECEPEQAGFNFLLHPGQSLTTASHMSWEPVERANADENSGPVEYLVEVVLEVPESDSDDTQWEVQYEETTDITRTQIPREFRNGPYYVRVSAQDNGGPFEESERQPIAWPLPTPASKICSDHCDGRTYSYQLSVYGDSQDGSEPRIRIETGFGVRAYEESDYLQIVSSLPTAVKEEVTSTVVGTTSGSGNVYDANCNTLSGKVYFVPKDAGVWQPNVNQILETTALANDGFSQCAGGASTLQGKISIFNVNSQSSAGLTSELECVPVCGPTSGSGSLDDDDFWDTGWPWGTFEDPVYPDPIPGSGSDSGTQQPGWADDISLGDMLRSLGERFPSTDISPPLQLQSLSVMPIGDGEPIELDIERVRNERLEYIEEILPEIEEGLYLLSHYFGGHRVHNIASLHLVADEG